MKKVRFLFVGIVMAVLTGFAGLNTTPYSHNLVETKLILSEPNYRIVKEVSGEWTATYVFGIGSLSRKSLETNAIGEMYKNA